MSFFTANVYPHKAQGPAFIGNCHEIECSHKKVFLKTVRTFSPQSAPQGPQPAHFARTGPFWTLADG